VNTVISPKREFTREQNSEKPLKDFLNTERKIVSFILCQKIIDSGQVVRRLFSMTSRKMWCLSMPAFFASNQLPIGKKYENQITQNGHSRYCNSSIGVTSNASEG
jgi:hypothetical protein